MTSVTLPTFNLRIWRPCRWDREYLDTATRGPAIAEHFQECLYSWSPPNSPFDCISDPDATERLRNALLDTFAPSNPSSERGLDAVATVITLIDEILEHESASSWAELAHTTRTTAGEQLQLRQHPLLALRHHLQWLFDTFKHAPSTSITIL